MFESVSLREVAADHGLVGGPFGSSLTGKDYTESGVPVIRGGNMGPGNSVSGEFAFVSVGKYENELSRNSAVPGDLVFTQRGTLGQVAIVPETPYPVYVVSQSQMRLRVDKSRYDRRFVLYACATSHFEQQIRDNAIATGVPHINLGILTRLTIPSPPLLEQRAIAEVLGALDDKIAANRRVVATCEGLSIALAATGRDLRQLALGVPQVPRPRVSRHQHRRAARDDGGAFRDAPVPVVPGRERDTRPRGAGGDGSLRWPSEA